MKKFIFSALLAMITMTSISSCTKTIDLDSLPANVDGAVVEGYTVSFYDPRTQMADIIIAKTGQVVAQNLQVALKGGFGSHPVTLFETSPKIKPSIQTRHWRITQLSNKTVYEPKEDCPYSMTPGNTESSGSFLAVIVVAGVAHLERVQAAWSSQSFHQEAYLDEFRNYDGITDEPVLSYPTTKDGTYDGMPNGSVRFFATN